jgi:hypothetical protein
MRHRPLAAIVPALTLAVLLLAGCQSMPRFLGGGGGDLRLMLDGEQEHSGALHAGHLLTLDMRDPAASGYAFAGTSFDPGLLRLDGIVPGDDGRVRYHFTALAAGQCDVEIKIRKDDPGKRYRPDVFKIIHVTVN